VWYEQLPGHPPLCPNDTEAVWELAEHRYVCIEQLPERAGHALHTVVVDDFDLRIVQIADRGLEPANQEIYPSGARKVIYVDTDGNEMGFGGGPVGAPPARKGPEQSAVNKDGQPTGVRQEQVIGSAAYRSGGGLEC
jgi:hypothetical protein